MSFGKLNFVECVSRTTVPITALIMFAESRHWNRNCQSALVALLKVGNIQKRGRSQVKISRWQLQLLWNIQPNEILGTLRKCKHKLALIGCMVWCIWESAHVTLATGKQTSCQVANGICYTTLADRKCSDSQVKTSLQTWLWWNENVIILTFQLDCVSVKAMPERTLNSQWTSCTASLTTGAPPPL